MKPAQHTVMLRQIAHGSAAYSAACALRNRVLRLPLGLDLYREDLAAEVSQLHFGLYDEADALLACVSVVVVRPHLARIRQMAVQLELHGLGYGRAIMHAVEMQLMALGIQRMELHARVSAVAFYAKLGFSIIGVRYLEVGLPHQSMVKDIPA